METWIEPKEMIMYEQLHATDLLLDCVTMCTVHYGCDCDCDCNFGCTKFIICHVFIDVCDRV